MTNKYIIGDILEITDYGHNIYQFKEGDKTPEDSVVDIAPEMVGQAGWVVKVKFSQGRPIYSLSEVNGKTAWYNEDQLKRWSPKSYNNWVKARQLSRIDR